MVGHLPRHLKVKGLSPSTLQLMEERKCKGKRFKTWPSEVAQW
jgi:hypothetical protein